MPHSLLIDAPTAIPDTATIERDPHSALRNLVALQSSGYPQHEHLHRVVRAVIARPDNSLRRLFYYYLETLTDESSLVVCMNQILKDLSSPNEYLRASVLRFVSRLETGEYLSHLLKGIVENLSHKSAFVRTNAVACLCSVARRFEIDIETELEDALRRESNPTAIVLLLSSMEQLGIPAGSFCRNIALNTTDEQVWLWLVRGSSDAEFLSELLSSCHPPVVSAAASKLLRISKRALGPFSDLYDSASPETSTCLTLHSSALGRGSESSGGGDGLNFGGKPSPSSQATEEQGKDSDSAERVATSAELQDEAAAGASQLSRKRGEHINGTLSSCSSDSGTEATAGNKEGSLQSSDNRLSSLISLSTSSLIAAAQKSRICRPDLLNVLCLIRGHSLDLVSLADQYDLELSEKLFRHALETAETHEFVSISDLIWAKYEQCGTSEQSCQFRVLLMDCLADLSEEFGVVNEGALREAQTVFAGEDAALAMASLRLLGASFALKRRDDSDSHRDKDAKGEIAKECDEDAAESGKCVTGAGNHGSNEEEDGTEQKGDTCSRKTSVSESPVAKIIRELRNIRYGRVFRTALDVVSGSCTRAEYNLLLDTILADFEQPPFYLSTESEVCLAGHLALAIQRGYKKHYDGQEKPKAIGILVKLLQHCDSAGFLDASSRTTITLCIRRLLKSGNSDKDGTSKGSLRDTNTTTASGTTNDVGREEDKGCSLPLSASRAAFNPVGGNSVVCLESKAGKSNWRGLEVTAPLTLGGFCASFEDEKPFMVEDKPETRETVYQLSGLGDPLYVEASVETRKFEVSLDILLINQTEAYLQDLSIDFVVPQQLVLITRLSPISLQAGAAATLKANFGVKQGISCFVGGTLAFRYPKSGEYASFYTQKLSEVPVDISVFLEKAVIDDFKGVWRELAWENAFSVIISQCAVDGEELLSGLAEHCRGYLCSRLAGNGFLLANLACRTAHGVLLLINTAISSTEKGNTRVEVRVRGGAEMAVTGLGAAIASYLRMARE